jgi:hypothetical protein
VWPVFHGVSWQHRSTSIGYWLAESAQGRGIMTRTVRTLVDHAFGEWRLHRVEIRAAVGNRRSRAIPERLGFTEEGVAREAELIGDRYLDQVIYSVLAGRWSEMLAPAALMHEGEAKPPHDPHNKASAVSSSGRNCSVRKPGTDRGTSNAGYLTANNGENRR